MKKKVLFALIFWVVYCLSFAVFYSGYAGFVKSLFFSANMVIFQAVISYINLLVWIPLFLKKKSFILYAVAVLGTIAFLTLIRFQIHSFLVDESRRVFTVRARMFFFIFNLLLAYSVSTAYYFGMEWFKNMQIKAEMKYRQVETELKYLKSQINPHFLFNTLNNIYTLCYLKDDKAAPAVMKLSEMMRYMLYESNTEVIELEKEVSFIRNYLELQRLKKDTPMLITFKVHGVKGRHKIAPLLLISFFENCFKHGDIETNPQGWIKAELTVNERNEMSLDISNSKRQNELSKEIRNHVGIENVRNRLDILYNGKHELTFAEENNCYNVHLFLKLDV